MAGTNPVSTPFVDVAVIGGGPAGLSAAVRCRWVKGHKAIALRTVIFESGDPGGLAAWRGTYLTGPGFYLDGADLVQKLQADVQQFEIPVVQATVLAVRPNDDCMMCGRWRIETTSGIWTADAVVVATGLRAQYGEGRLFGRGVYIPYMSYEHLYKLLRRIPVTRGTAQPIYVVGNAKSALLAPVLQTIAAESGCTFRVVVAEAIPPSQQVAVDWMQGDFAGVYSHEDAMYIDLWLEGQLRRQPAAGVIVDYNAFELQPQSTVVLPVTRNPQGHIPVDAAGRTDAPGIYAAGDITPGYAMALRAMASGAQAGFAAYEDLYFARFGHSPHLYAYRPTDQALHSAMRALPQWQPTDELDVLSPAQLTGVPLTFAELVQVEGSVEQATDRLDSWLEKKWVTVRRKANHGPL